MKNLRSLFVVLSCALAVACNENNSQPRIEANQDRPLPRLPQGETDNYSGEEGSLDQGPPVSSEATSGPVKSGPLDSIEMDRASEEVRTAEQQQGTDSRLAMLFTQLLDQAHRVDEIERLAGELVAEVYNEDDLIRPKVWELQNLIKERYEQNRYTPASSQKVKILEAGLAQAAMRRDLYKIGEDAAIILGSAIGLSVIRGYGLDREIGNWMNNAVDRAKRGAAGARDAAASLLRPRTYREAGERVERWFAGTFRKLTPEERLMRNLEAMGLRKSELELVERNLLPDNQADYARLINLKYSRTNMRNVGVAAVRPKKTTANRYGYLAFRQTSGPALNRRISYHQTDMMSEASLRRLLDKLYYGKDRRVFVEFVTENGDVRTSRVMADRFKDAVTRIRDTSRGTVRNTIRQMGANFNGSRASQTFVYSLPLMSAGYALALARDYDFSNMYLESLLEGPITNPQVQQGGR